MHAAAENSQPELIDPAEVARARQWLTPEELAGLTKLRPWVASRDLTITWLAIFATMQIALWARSVPVYIAAFILIACFQNALTLWVHEATHYNITRKHRLNDALGDFFMGGPIGLTVGQYRWHHVPHHRHLNDPEHEVNPLAWTCIRGAKLLKEIAVTMFGKYGMAAMSRYGGSDPAQAKRPGRTRAALAGFTLLNALLVAQCALQGQWWAWFALWCAPIVTLTLLIGNLRTMVEHQPSSDVCDVGRVKLPPVTRVMHSNAVERVLIAPVGLHWHYEHHMFKAVPYYRLREVRRMLKERGFFDQTETIQGSGYVRTLWKLAMQPGYGLRVLNPFFTPSHEHVR